VTGGEALQMGDVTQRIGGLLSGETSRVRGAVTWLLAWMDLDQLRAVEHAHELAVSADLDAGAEEVPRHRIERLGDLDVMIAMHPTRRVDRHVIDLVRDRQQMRLFLEAEMFERPALRRAMHPHPRPPSAPRRRLRLGVCEVAERLTIPERRPDELHHPLHAWLVRRCPNTSRVDHEPA